MTESARKILFLDYDGVLHRDAVFVEHRRPVLRGDGVLFEWTPLLACALEPYPEVKIVLSTSWSRMRGFSRARDVLPQPLRDKVIGSTWHSAMGKSEIGGFRLPTTWWDSSTRYQQIAAYVARVKTALNWLAIDDNDEGWAKEHRDRLVLTDPERGLSDPKVLALLRARLDSLCGLGR